MVLRFDGAKPHDEAGIQVDVEVECYKHGFTSEIEKHPAKSHDSNILEPRSIHLLIKQVAKIKNRFRLATS